MDLTEIRKEIDKVDDTLLKAFLRRMDLSKDVAEYKKQNNIPTLNKKREREILADVMEKSGELAPYSHRLYQTLFELSRAYQVSLSGFASNIRSTVESSIMPEDSLFPDSGSVACQGVEGAYSQMAADRMFPRGNISFFKSFEGVFNAVENGLCQYGVLPIENSSNGSVRAVYDLLRQKNVFIVRSMRLCVSHCLLVKPGVKLSDITEIHSHEQALGQCSDFLKSLGDKVKVIADPNTAMAAELVSKSPDPGIAAIASSGCAGLYGLVPLDAPIQNSENNYTRFICIGKNPQVFPGANKISLILSLEHRPGSLYEVMAEFAAREINLLKLESCPMVGHDFEFLFFFDVEASVRDPKVLNMLEYLERSCPGFTYLGNYQEV